MINLKQKMLAVATSLPMLISAQNLMTPEKLWTLKRMSVQVVAPDQSGLIYKVGQTDLETEKPIPKTTFST